MDPMEEILEFMREEGFRPKLDEDGDYVFKSEGDNVYLSIEVAPMLYTTLTTIWKLGSVEDPLVRGNAVNGGLKVVKAYVSSSVVSFAIEQHCTVESFKLSLERNLMILQMASEKFYND